MQSGVFFPPIREQAPVVPELTIEELEKLLKDNDKFWLFDVRDQSEYDAGHIPGVIHNEQNAKTHAINTTGLGFDDKIIISCQSGYRSAFVTKGLLDAGFTNVKSLHGGFKAWQEKGFPIEKHASLGLGK